MLLSRSVRNVVIAGVVQASSVSEGSLLQVLGLRSGLTLIALHISENKFTGTDVTDMGNPFFNTTHLS